MCTSWVAIEPVMRLLHAAINGQHTLRDALHRTIHWTMDCSARNSARCTARPPPRLTYYAGLAPASVGAFQSRPHNLHAARRVEGVIHAPPAQHSRNAHTHACTHAYSSHIKRQIMPSTEQQRGPEAVEGICISSHQTVVGIRMSSPKSAIPKHYLLGLCDDVRLHAGAGWQLGWVDAICSPQTARDVKLCGVDVNGEYAGCIPGLGSLDDGQPHCTKAEDCHAGTCLDIAGLPCRT